MCEQPKMDMISKKDVAVGPKAPTLRSRYACAFLMLGIFGVWSKLAFLPEEEVAIVNGKPLHSFMVPLLLTAFYLISLPVLQYVTQTYLSKITDMKKLLRETMIVYNVGQVLANGWMVYLIIDALIYRGHPVIGNLSLVGTGATYATWLHYCDKYLEFFDTYFMVLRGKVKQVSFLHVYHHVSIAWAWWYGLYGCPGGDCYFGALLNSFIHVLMYSYYALKLLKVECAWKRYLTQAQLLQFFVVVVYTVFSYSINKERATPLQKSGFCVQGFEMLSLIVLFMQFYIQSYWKKRGTRKQEAGQEKKEA